MKKQHNTKNPYLIPLAIVIAGVLVAGAIFVSPRLGSGDPPADTPGGEIPPQGDAAVELEGWPILGDPDAPVLMVEYSDFACPFCARFHHDTFPSIQRDYIDTGKVRFVYKDLVVVGGDRAAEASHCAAEQGKFWEYHDLLFAHQTQDRARWADVAVHRGYAQQLGMDEDALAECFNERRYREKVARSMQEARQNGDGGTPYFLINGRSISGAQPYAAFQAVLDLALDD